MDWWKLLEYGIVLYVAFGAYCGYQWTRHDPDSEPWPVAAAMTVGAALGVLSWPFFIASKEEETNAPKPVKRSKANKTALEERRRMDREYAEERGRVEMLECSADHRARMAELDERRQRVEELT